MTAKECRGVFNEMMKALKQMTSAGPPQQHLQVMLFQTQALWEIAAQLSEMNERQRQERGIQ